MSGWLNNSFGKVTSLTGQIGGQISNFTREVLADEDDQDEEAMDIKKLKLKLVQFEENAKSHQQEIGRYRRLNDEMENKLRVCEEQKKSIVQSYNDKIKEQSNLIIELRSQLESDTSSSLHDDDGGYHVIVGSHGSNGDITLIKSKLKEKYREFDVSFGF